MSARTARSSVGVLAGRTTAWRNIFGSDPDSLEQNVALARATHKAFDWLDVNLRGSSIRTRNLKEFPFTIAAFVVIILGGLGNLTGSLVGGLVLGVLETYGVALTAPTYQSILIYGVFILVLVWRPQGLFGGKGRGR